MSDLCMYELEDLEWDGCAESDDHIVPHPGKEQKDQCVVQNDSCKKPRREVVDIRNNADRYEEYYSQGSEETSVLTLNTGSDRMLEESWSQKPDGVLHASSDGEMLPSDGTKSSDHGFKNSNVHPTDSNFCLDPTLNKKCAAVDNNMFQYSNSQITQSDSALDFCDNGLEDKDISDLFYYEWPDIGNFEDVDQMFRNCDSTFGVGDASNEDEFCWFSNPHTVGGSEDALKSGLKSSYSESSPLKSMLGNHDTPQQDHESLLVNGLDRRSACSSYSTNCQTSESVEPTGHAHNSHVDGLGNISEYRNKCNSSEQINYSGKQSKHLNQILENGVYFHHSGSLKQSSDVKLPVTESSQRLSSTGIGQQQRNVTYGNPFKTQTKVYHSSENEAEAHSEIDGAETRMFTDLDSSNAQQSSCTSPVLVENSLEENSFCHLQQVMEQLDIRTKLCIRDSLYRLARNAEQRHNSVDERNPSEALVAGSKCTGLLDIETDTNPIDRSIAHLLFHRPSNPPVEPPTHNVPLKSHKSNHQSIIGPPVMVESMVGGEEKAAAADGTLLITNKNE